MKQETIQSLVTVCQMEELSQEDQQLVELAKEATFRSYARYSNFHVGAALRTEDGEVVIGCNQENAAFPAGLCAERTALFAAGAQYPDKAVDVIAIAARNQSGDFTPIPISPCGSCRQVLVETEQRFSHPVRIILYGARYIYQLDSIRHLMPLSFTEEQL